MSQPNHPNPPSMMEGAPAFVSSKQASSRRDAAQLIAAAVSPPKADVTHDIIEREARVSWGLFREVMYRHSGSFPDSSPSSWRKALSSRIRLLMWEQQNSKTRRDFEPIEAALMHLLATSDALALGRDGDPSLQSLADPMCLLFSSPVATTTEMTYLTYDTLCETTSSQTSRLEELYKLGAISAITDWLSTPTSPEYRGVVLPALLSGPTKSVPRAARGEPLAPSPLDPAKALLSSWGALFEHLVPQLIVAWEASVEAYITSLRKDLAVLRKARTAASERELAELRSLLAKAEKTMGPKYQEFEAQHSLYTQSLSLADKRSSCILELEKQIETASHLSEKHLSSLRAVSEAGATMGCSTKWLLEGIPIDGSTTPDPLTPLSQSYPQSEVDVDVVVPTILSPVHLDDGRVLIASQEALYVMRVLCSIPRVLSPFAHTNDAGVSRNQPPNEAPTAPGYFPTISHDSEVCSMDECPVLTAAMTTGSMLSLRGEIVALVSSCLLAVQGCSVPQDRLDRLLEAGDLCLTEHAIPIGELVNSPTSSTMFVAREYTLRRECSESRVTMNHLQQLMQPLNSVPAAHLHTVNVPKVFSTFVDAVREGVEGTCVVQADCADQILASVGAIGGMVVGRKRADSEMPKQGKSRLTKWIWGGTPPGDVSSSTAASGAPVEDPTRCLLSVQNYFDSRPQDRISCAAWLAPPQPTHCAPLVQGVVLLDSRRRWYAIERRESVFPTNVEAAVSELYSQVSKKYPSPDAHLVFSNANGLNVRWASVRLGTVGRRRPSLLLNQPPGSSAPNLQSPVRAAQDGTVMVQSDSLSRLVSPTGHDLLVALLTSAPGAISSLSPHLTSADLFVLALCAQAVPHLTTSVPLSSFANALLPEGRQYAAPILFPHGSSSATPPSLPVTIEPHPLVLNALQAPGGVPQASLISGLSTAIRKGQAGTLKGFLSVMASEGSSAHRTVGQLIASAEGTSRSVSRLNVHGVFAAFATGAALSPPFMVPTTASASLEPSLYSFAPIPAAQMSLPNFPGSEWHPGGVSSSQTTSQAATSSTQNTSFNLVELVLRAYYTELRDTSIVNRGSWGALWDKVQQASCPSSSAALSELLSAAYPSPRQCEATALCSSAILALASGVRMLDTSTWGPIFYPHAGTTRLKGVSQTAEAALQQCRPSVSVSDAVAVIAFTSLQTLNSMFSFPMAASVTKVHRGLSSGDVVPTSTLVCEDPFAFCVGLVTPRWFFQARSGVGLLAAGMLTALSAGPPISQSQPLAPLRLESASTVGVSSLGAVAVAQSPKFNSSGLHSAHGNVGLFLASHSLVSHRRGNLLAGSLLTVDDGVEASGAPVSVEASWRFVRLASVMQAAGLRCESDALSGAVSLIKRLQSGEEVPPAAMDIVHPYTATPNAHLGILEPHLHSNLFAAGWSLPHRARNDHSTFDLVLDTLRCSVALHHLFALRQLPLSTIASTLSPPCASLISSQATFAATQPSGTSLSTAGLDTELALFLSGGANSCLRILANPTAVFEASGRQCAMPCLEMLPSALVPPASHNLRSRPLRREQLRSLLEAPSWLTGVGVVSEHWARRLTLPHVPTAEGGTTVSTLLRSASSLTDGVPSLVPLKCAHCSPLVLAEGRSYMLSVLSLLRDVKQVEAAKRGLAPPPKPTESAGSNYTPAAALRFLMSNATALLSIAAPGNAPSDIDPMQQAMLFAFRTVATLDSQVQSLSHALHLLVNGGPTFRRAPITTTITVRQLLFPLIVHAALREEPELYRTAVTLFLTMRRQFNGEVSLVQETGSFFNHVVFFELSKGGHKGYAPGNDPSDAAYASINGPHVTYPMICKMRLMLQFITALCEEPRNLVELFVHFDCDPTRSENLFERILRTLSRLTTGTENPSLPQVESRQVDSSSTSHSLGGSTLLRTTDVVGAGISASFLSTAAKVGDQTDGLLVPFDTADAPDELRARYTPFTHGEVYEEALCALLMLPMAVTQWIDRFQTEATTVTKGASPEGEEACSASDNDGWSSSEDEPAASEEPESLHSSVRRRAGGEVSAALENRRVKRYFAKFFVKFNIQKDPPGAMALLDPTNEELRMLVSTSESKGKVAGESEALIESQILMAVQHHDVLEAVFSHEQLTALVTPLAEDTDVLSPPTPQSDAEGVDEDAIQDLRVVLPSPSQRRAAHRCARFLHAHADSIDKLLLGEYFSKMKRKPFVRGVFQYWTELHPFAGVGVDEALRMLLGGFKLLGEAQVVDTTMGIFATAYSSQQPPPTAESTFVFGRDTVFILAFSICMLNTDAHSRHIPTKMTADEFVRNNRGIADGGDVPLEVMKAIYSNVSAKEIRLRPTPRLPETSPQRMSESAAEATPATTGTAGAVSATRIPLLRLLSPVAGMVSTAIKLPLIAAESLVGRRDHSLSEAEQQAQARKARQQVQHALAAALADLNTTATSTEMAADAAEALRSAGLEHAIPMWELCVDRVAVAIGSALSSICRGDVMGSSLRYKSDTTASAYVGSRHALHRIGGNVVNMVGTVATILVKNPLSNTLGTAAAGVLAFAFGADEGGASGFSWHEKQDVEGGTIPLEQYVLSAAAKYSRACAVLGYTSHLVDMCSLLQALASVPSSVLVVPNLAANLRTITTGEARSAMDRSYPLSVEEGSWRSDRIQQECAAAKSLMGGSADGRRGVCDAYTAVAQSWIPLRRLRCAVAFIDCVSASGFAVDDVEGARLYEAAFKMVSRLQIVTEDEPVWLAAENLLEMLAVGDLSSGKRGRSAAPSFPVDPVALISGTSQLLLSGGKKLISTATSVVTGPAGPMASVSVSNNTTLAEHVIASVANLSSQGGKDDSSHQTSLGRVFTSLATAVASGGSSIFNPQNNVDIGAMLHTVRRLHEGDGEEAMSMLVPSLGIMHAERDSAIAFLVSTLLVGALMSARPEEQGSLPPPSIFPHSPASFVAAGPQLLSHFSTKEGGFAVPAAAVAAALSLTPYQLVFSHLRLRAAMKRNIERATPSLTSLSDAMCAVAKDAVLAGPLSLQAMDSVQLPLVRGLAKEARREASQENRTQSLSRLADVLRSQLARHVAVLEEGIRRSAADVKPIDGPGAVADLTSVSSQWLQTLRRSNTDLNTWLTMFLGEALPSLQEVFGMGGGSDTQGCTLDGGEYSNYLFVPARDVVVAAARKCILPVVQAVLEFTFRLRHSLHRWMRTSSDVAILRAYSRAGQDGEDTPQEIEERLRRRLGYIRHTSATLLASFHHIDESIISSCFGVEVSEADGAPTLAISSCSAAVPFTTAASVEAVVYLAKWLAARRCPDGIVSPMIPLSPDMRLVVAVPDPNSQGGTSLSAVAYGQNNVSAARQRVSTLLMGGLTNAMRDEISALVSKVLMDGDALVLPCPSLSQWADNLNDLMTGNSSTDPLGCGGGGAWGAVVRFFEALGGAPEVPLSVRLLGWNQFRSTLLNTATLRSMSGAGDVVDGTPIWAAMNSTAQPRLHYRTVQLWSAVCSALRAFALTPEDSVRVSGAGPPDQQVIVVPVDGSLPKNSSKLSPLEVVRCGAAVTLARSAAGVPSIDGLVSTGLLGRFAVTPADVAPPAVSEFVYPSAALLRLVLTPTSPVVLPQGTLPPSPSLAWYALHTVGSLFTSLHPQSSLPTQLTALSALTSILAPVGGQGNLLFGHALDPTFATLGAVLNTAASRPSNGVSVYSSGAEKTATFERTLSNAEGCVFYLMRGVSVCALGYDCPTKRVCEALAAFIELGLSCPAERSGETLATLIGAVLNPMLGRPGLSGVVLQDAVISVVLQPVGEEVDGAPVSVLSLPSVPVWGDLPLGAALVPALMTYLARACRVEGDAPYHVTLSSVQLVRFLVEVLPNGKLDEEASLVGAVRDAARRGVTTLGVLLLPTTYLLLHHRHQVNGTPFPFWEELMADVTWAHESLNTPTSEVTKATQALYVSLCTALRWCCQQPAGVPPLESLLGVMSALPSSWDEGVLHGTLVGGKRQIQPGGFFSTFPTANLTYRHLQGLSRLPLWDGRDVTLGKLAGGSASIPVALEALSGVTRPTSTESLLQLVQGMLRGHILLSAH